MATTRRAMRTLEATKADSELIASVLAARSDAEATVAFSLLRYSLPDRELVQLANLREILRLLPTSPFRTGESLEILGRAAGYENTGRSYRRAFDSSTGVFGLEFLGGDHACRGILIHTPNGRRGLAGDDQYIIDGDLLPLLIEHAILLDAILEALALLGSPLDPAIYVTAGDFVAEHGRETMRDTLGGLF